MRFYITIIGERGFERTAFLNQLVADSTARVRPGVTQTINIKLGKDEESITVFFNENDSISSCLRNPSDGQIVLFNSRSRPELLDSIEEARKDYLTISPSHPAPMMIVDTESDFPQNSDTITKSEIQKYVKRCKAHYNPLYVDACFSRIDRVAAQRIVFTLLDEVTKPGTWEDEEKKSEEVAVKLIQRLLVDKIIYSAAYEGSKHDFLENLIKKLFAINSRKEIREIIDQSSQHHCVDYERFHWLHQHRRNLGVKDETRTRQLFHELLEIVEDSFLIKAGPVDMKFYEEIISQGETKTYERRMSK